MSDVGTFRRDGVYRRRWMWWYPWGVTRPWLPRVFRGGDEWCNDSIAVVIPPLGALIVFWRPGPLRNFPGAAVWHSMDQAQQEDYGPCGWLRGGRLRADGHHHTQMDEVCPTAFNWLIWEADHERRLEPDCPTCFRGYRR